MSIPSPSVMQRFAPTNTAHTTESVKRAPVIVADFNPEQSAKIVRPGLREQTIEAEHDGVVKAKRIEPGMTVQAWLNGAPKGGERVVGTVTPSKDGSTVTIEFTSPHPTTEYKAAYRFFVQSLVGTTYRYKRAVPALVPYEEV